MHIIGLGCTAQVGKDTAAEYLEKKYPGKVKRVAFADQLKNVARDLFDLSWEQCYGSHEVKEAVDPRYAKSPRQIMQELGEKMREIHPSIWVDKVLQNIIPRYALEGYDCFIVSDMRYPNEANGIIVQRGVVVKVDRKGVGVNAGKDHSSETALRDFNKFDFVVDNNGSFEEFYNQLDLIMHEIGYVK